MAERRRYDGRDVVVTFDGARCLHAAECVRGLPDVFDTGRRPWVLPDAAPAERVAEVVRRCPTGALRYEPGPGLEPEREPDPPVVTARPHEPLWIRGHVLLDDGSGDPTPDLRAALCRCGATANAPYCDAGGDCTAWRSGG